MNKFFKPLALLALTLIIGPPAILLIQSLGSDSAAAVASEASAATGDSGPMTDGLMKHLVLAGTLLWFATAPFWLKEDD